VGEQRRKEKSPFLCYHLHTYLHSLKINKIIFEKCVGIRLRLRLYCQVDTQNYSSAFNPSRLAPVTLDLYNRIPLAYPGSAIIIDWQVTGKWMSGGEKG